MPITLKGGVEGGGAVNVPTERVSVRPYCDIKSRKPRYERGALEAGKWL